MGEQGMTALLMQRKSRPMAGFSARYGYRGKEASALSQAASRASPTVS